MGSLNIVPLQADEIDVSARPRNSYLLSILHARGQNARRHGRIQTRDITCSLGKVLDISASGMRLVHRSLSGLNNGDEGACTVGSVHGSFSVYYRIAWARRISLSKWEMGVEFIEPTPKASEVLALIARAA